MKHITELKNGGRDRQCLIVGGGHSVADFPFFRLPHNITVIGLNYHDPVFIIHNADFKLDYVIYIDNDFKQIMGQTGYPDNIRGNAKLIGYKSKRKHEINKISDRCNYYYDDETIDINGIQSVLYYALQIANDIMRFDKIFLIGIDNKFVSGESHYWHDKILGNTKTMEITPQQKQLMSKHMHMTYKLFARKTNYNNVYNCNPDSNVDCWPYGVPW